MSSIATRSIIAVPALILVPALAQAHAFAQRYDLPLPLWLYLVGAGAAVALSFVAATQIVRVGAGLPGRREFGLRVHPALVMMIKLVSVFLFALIIVAGFFGTQSVERNILPVFVWVIWWVGLAYVNALVGDLWCFANPWTAVAEWCAAGLHVIGVDRSRPPMRLPEWVGVWPAVLLFLAFSWAELVWPTNAVPAQLATAIILYSAVTWIGMGLFGIEQWRQRGEAFSVFFGLFARFAPIAVDTTPDGAKRLAFRFYGSGLLSDSGSSPAKTAFVILALATVGFDGIHETAFWQDLTGSTQTALYETGLTQHLGYVVADAFVKTMGLLLTPVVFFGVILAFSAVTAKITQGTPLHVLRRFVLTLVPIAIAYHLAHYLSYLLFQGQMAIPLISDPFGFGWDLFGTRKFEPDIAVVGARFVWVAAVVCIVLGHVAAVVLAHSEALRTYEPRIAVRAQYPMLILMIGYTMLSLWILSQPIVVG